MYKTKAKDKAWQLPRLNSDAMPLFLCDYKMQNVGCVNNLKLILT
jgi:hypothetical protein